MKTFIIVLIVIIIAAISIFYLIQPPQDGVDGLGDPDTAQLTDAQDVDADMGGEEDEVEDVGETVIGQSIEGRDIVAYHYGQGDTELLFVGGIHGGYEWNTALLAYKVRDYLEQNPETIPANVRATIIPVLNPDGLNEVVGTANGDFTQADVTASQTEQEAARFNSNNVDLNRNFDCDWQSVGTWQSRTVSGGDAVFSEPESQAIKNYVETNKPTAIVTWYSAAGGVFSSSCHNGVSAETNTLTEKYAEASGYPAHESFDFYAITGDMVNWFAKKDIPAISVLLTDHTDIEWSKNKAGVEAILGHYSQ